MPTPQEHLDYIATLPGAHPFRIAIIRDALAKKDATLGVVFWLTYFAMLMVAFGAGMAFNMWLASAVGVK
jgi:hypothetical protein